MRKLLPGDVVLVDRGFLIEQHVAEELAHLVTPAFKGTRPRLTKEEMTNSRKVANVRIHVERCIGHLRRGFFSILQGRITVEELRKDGDAFAFFDKIMYV